MRDGLGVGARWVVVRGSWRWQQRMSGSGSGSMAFLRVNSSGGAHVLASATEVHIGGNRRGGTCRRAERRRWPKAQVFRDDKKNSRRPAPGSLVVIGVHATVIGMGLIYLGICALGIRAEGTQKNRQPSRVCRFYVVESSPGAYATQARPYQPSAATAALKVLLGRITASSLATSGW